MIAVSSAVISHLQTLTATRVRFLPLPFEGVEVVSELQLHLKNIFDVKPASSRTLALMKEAGWEVRFL